MRVVLNSRLKGEITNNIRHKFSLRIQKASEKIKTAQVADEIYSLLFTPAQQVALKVLPPNLIPTQNTMYFTYHGEKFEINLSEQLALPAEYRNHYNPGKLNIIKPEVMAAFDEFIATKREVQKEREEFVSKITEMMGQVATLNQLVQIWPSAVEFCDKDTVERLNRKVERFKPESIDVPDETKLAIAKVRMSQL